MHRWRRHFFYTREVTRATWKVRIGTVILLILIVVSTRRWWEAEIARSLTCAEDIAPSHAILVENFDPNYLLFERAAALQQAGVAPTVLVPVRAAPEPYRVNHVAKGFAEVMARQARLDDWEMIPVDDVEPISLNMARQLRDDLARRRLTSVTVVTSRMRSRRSSLINRSVLGANGTQVHCAPVSGVAGSERWTDTWHGIQTVAEEFLKLQYYRLYVLPFQSRSRP
jgi:hypothetical protein